MSAKPTGLTVRCPLCKEEGITAPADDATFTNNGVDAVSGGKGGRGEAASKTVLKWGGGHAKEKKTERSLKRKGKECKFGDACTREGCWFLHPRDEGGGVKKAKIS
jgi:hypothetical protein